MFAIDFQMYNFPFLFGFSYILHILQNFSTKINKSVQILNKCGLNYIFII